MEHSMRGVSPSRSSSTLLPRLRVKLRWRIVVISVLLASTLLNVFLVTLLHDKEVETGGRFLITEQPQQHEDHAKLTCDAYGGPSPEFASEMVYWRSDPVGKEHQFQSTYQSNATKYFVFQPDEAGFSNVRMAFETAVALAKAMNRTLVLPPKGRFAQLLVPGPGGGPRGIQSYFLTDFFDISGIPTISFEDYLRLGTLRTNKGQGSVATPPDDRYNWDGLIGNSNNAGKGDAQKLWQWVEDCMPSIHWNRDNCVVAFPSNATNTGSTISTAQQAFDWILQDDADHNRPARQRIDEYDGKPVDLDAPVTQRLREMLADRKQLCHYNEILENSESIFQTGTESTGRRLLIPFTAYMLFEDWKQGVAMKRFIRDHLRYADVIQCAAARIVKAIRERAAQHNSGDGGRFDTMHSRRQDFTNLPTYKDSSIPADKMRFFDENRTVYIATDESNRTFFDPLRVHYNLLFLDDFLHLLPGVDRNFYGMIEQLVCSKGDKFVGTYYSTFSGYINRIRGYHVQKARAPGYMTGAIASEYMGFDGAFQNVMRKYMSVRASFWAREWPTAWRDIDHDVLPATVVAPPRAGTTRVAASVPPPPKNRGGFFIHKPHLVAKLVERRAI